MLEHTDALSAPAIARTLGISRSKLYSWLKPHVEAGRIRRFAFGHKTVRYSLADVLAAAAQDGGRRDG